MEPGLANAPATRWDRLMAVLDEIDPERVIDASHIIERERKSSMTDLELFYILAIHYQDKSARVLWDVLNLYVLLISWMGWMENVNECLCLRRKNPKASKTAQRTDHLPPALQKSASAHHLLHPLSSASMRVSRVASGESDDCFSTEGSVAASSVHTPLARSSTAVLASTLGCGGELADSLVSSMGKQNSHCNTSGLSEGGKATDLLKDGMLRANTGFSADLLSHTQRLPREEGKNEQLHSPTRVPGSANGAAALAQSPTERGALLVGFDLPENWAKAGTLDFLRDGKILCSLVEEALKHVHHRQESERVSSPINAPPTDEYDRQFPSLADIDRLSGNANANHSFSALHQMGSLSLSHVKSRSRRSRTSRTLRIIEAQGNRVAETEQSVVRLNRLCENHLGWKPSANGGKKFFEFSSGDRLMRPLNADDVYFLHRLHWMAVALFKTVNDSSVVPLPPRVSFLFSGESPGASVDDSEENSELGLLIATKYSCLPHSHKLRLVVVEGNVMRVSHPVAHPQPVILPCCVIEGEAFVYIEQSQTFLPLWCVLKQLLQEWDSMRWRFELPVLERKAEQVLRIKSCASASSSDIAHSPSLTGDAASEASLQSPNLGSTMRFSTKTPLCTQSATLPKGSSNGGTSSFAMLPMLHGSSVPTTPQTTTSEPPAKASFNLTIKNSTVQHSRVATISPSVSPKGRQATPAAGAGPRTVSPNASFVTECTEDTSNTSFQAFPPFSTVRRARQVGNSSALRKHHNPSCEWPIEMMPARAKAEHSGAVPMSTAVKAGRCVTAIAESPSDDWSPPSSSAAHPSKLIPSPDIGPKAHSPPPPPEQPADSADGDEEEEEDDGDEEDMDAEVPMACATLQAVEDGSNLVNTSAADAVGAEECVVASVLNATSSGGYGNGGNDSFVDDNFSPGTLSNGSPAGELAVAYSEIGKVRNFSATVVHESESAGIAVRDHHFRVSGRPIGKGAFGAVFRALDLDNGVVVAVKQSRYSIDSNDQGNLNWREFQMWSMLPSHPNVISFHGASKEVETHQLLLVLEYASGGSIIAMYQNFRPIPEHLFYRHAMGIALGLKHLHDHHVIHGDMKPENVLTRSDGSVAISDFGCSQLTLHSDSDNYSSTAQRLENVSKMKGGGSPLQLFGTAAYMAPEVITNEPDFKSDVWAYACTLLHLWVGRPPWAENPDTEFLHDSIPLMFYIASHEDVTPFTDKQLESAPRWLQRIAQRAFEHDVEKRCNMTEVLSILAEYMDSELCAAHQRESAV